MDYRNNNPWGGSVAQASSAPYDAGLRAYMLNVYNYMCSALALTGITAWVASREPLASMLYRFEGAHVGLTGLGLLAMFAPFVFIMVLSFGINRLSVPAAQGVFWAYAALMGVSLSSIFFVYSGASIARAFFITATLFGSMSLWGYSTKRDLTGMGHFMMMGLFGVIIAMFVNMLLHSSALQLALSVLSVVIFTALTAYDTQKIKASYYTGLGNGAVAGKTAILGALSLYLDFINLFIYMLRFFGDRRN